MVWMSNTAFAIQEILRLKRIKRAKMNKCGNPKHPNGAWHEATPLPLSNRWLERFKQWVRRK